MTWTKFEKISLNFMNQPILHWTKYKKIDITRWPGQPEYEIYGTPHQMAFDNLDLLIAYAITHHDETFVDELMKIV